MKLELHEIGKQYGVSLDLLHRLIDAGVLSDLMYDIEGDVFGEKAINRLASCSCLSSLGLDVKTVKQYIGFELSKKDTRNERIKILRKHRERNLNNLHEAKKTIDCIDCVMKELKSNSKHHL